MDEGHSVQLVRNLLVIFGAFVMAIFVYVTSLDLFGPLDPFGALAIVCTFLAFTGTASIWPWFRPAMSSFVAIFLAGWAWVTALFGFEMLSGDGMSGTSILASTSLLAFAYILWFRWAGNVELKRQGEARQDQASTLLSKELVDAIRTEIGQLIEQQLSEAVQAARGCRCQPQAAVLPRPPRESRSEIIRRLQKARHRR